MQNPSFGVSTHLYHDQRLNRDHLVEIAAHGFEAVEIFANAPHFDALDGAACAELIEAAAETGLRVHSVHAPIAAAVRGGAWEDPLSLASADEGARKRAFDAVRASLELAARASAPFLVVHVGVPDSERAAAGDNQADAARRSIDALAEAAAPLGVQLALEVIPNRLSTADALVTLIEDDLELPGAGLCLDFGHAFLMGDLVDAIETASGHMLTTHVHDNHGRADEHLVPFDGRIHWDAALMAVQKVGFDGAFVFELARSDNPREALERAQRARLRFEHMLATA